LRAVTACPPLPLGRKGRLKDPWRPGLWGSRKGGTRRPARSMSRRSSVRVSNLVGFFGVASQWKLVEKGDYFYAQRKETTTSSKSQGGMASLESAASETNGAQRGGLSRRLVMKKGLKRGSRVSPRRKGEADLGRQPGPPGEKMSLTKGDRNTVAVNSAKRGIAWNCPIGRIRLGGGWGRAGRAGGGMMSSTFEGGARLNRIN